MKIAVLDDYQGMALSLADWNRLPDDCEVVPFRDHIADREALIAALAGFEVVCVMRERTPLPAEVIERLTDLKLIVTAGARNASIDVAAAAARGIPVSGTRRSGPAAAELALALLFACARDIVSEAQSVREGGWQVGLGRDLAGTRLGIVGLGKLGARVARIGLALGMDVVAWSQNLSDERAAEVGVRKIEKDELFRTADFVSIHLVLSQRTRGLVAEAELALMKPDAALINTSRAAIVDTPALLRALTEKRLRNAAIDVFDIEPLPASDPVRSAPNLIATPHIGYVTREAYTIFFTDFVEDIQAFRSGRPIRLIAPK